jgi:hypothetical protein
VLIAVVLIGRPGSSEANVHVLCLAAADAGIMLCGLALQQLDAVIAPVGDEDVANLIAGQCYWPTR